MMKKALITGVTGQIGSYLAEVLLEKGYEVYGLVPRDQLGKSPERVRQIEGDLEDFSLLNKTIREVSPDEIYNLAGQSDAQASKLNSDYSFRVNYLAVKKIWETILEFNPKIKLFQTGSARFFGNQQGTV